jgi:hypothetical protein
MTGFLHAVDGDDGVGRERTDVGHGRQLGRQPEERRGG